MDILQRVVLIRKLDAKCFGKAVAEIVAGAGLQRLAVMHKRFNRVSRFGASKFFLVSLPSPYHRDREHFLDKISIDIEHQLRAFLRLFGSRMGSVPFLPQELPGTQERTGRLLPTEHGAPLVVNFRKIAV